MVGPFAVLSLSFLILPLTPSPPAPSCFILISWGILGSRWFSLPAKYKETRKVEFHPFILLSRLANRLSKNLTEKEQAPTLTIEISRRFRAPNIGRWRISPQQGPSHFDEAESNTPSKIDSTISSVKVGFQLLRYLVELLRHGKSHEFIFDLNFRRRNRHWVESSSSYHSAVVRYVVFQGFYEDYVFYIICAHERKIELHWQS